MNAVDIIARRELEIPAYVDTSRLPDGYLASIYEHATKHDLLNNLKQQFECLCGLYSSKKGNIVLTKDFAPFSMTFDAGWIYGGFIYHGNHDNYGDGGAPTYSVTVRPIYGWSLHT